jgi:GNAT superfamily N-acetyltransferase
VEKMSDFIIRKIELKDAGELCKICSEEMGYECAPALVKSKIEKLDLKREAVFVAEEESQLLGFIHVERYEVLYFESMANILGLAVKKDFQKQGLGKALLLAAEKWAQENGIHLMRLNSGINRIDAHGFYEHLGYVSEKEQKRFLKRLK